MKLGNILLFASVLLLVSAACSAQQMNGFIIDAEKEVVSVEHVNAISETFANTAVCVPYALTSQMIPRVEWNMEWQPAGVKEPGIIQAITNLKKGGMKLVLMPKLKLEGQGNIEKLEMLSDNDWKVWWMDYSDYVLSYAHIADSLDVDCFVVGNDLGSTIEPLAKEWKTLIDSIRGFYDGKLTYAADVSRFVEVPFWGALDYIGVNMELYCDSSETPDPELLQKCFSQSSNRLEEFSKLKGKPVLITSFGFRSVDQTAWKTDDMPSEEFELFLHTNLLGQVNAFQSFFKTFWGKPWLVGGWIWKWETSFPAFAVTGNGYSPQGKPALEVIQAWFKQFE